jgi:hypothetical protein
MNRQERYAARSVRFLELWECGEWRIKLYGIAYRGASPDASLIAAAKDLVISCLPAPATTEQRYGVGFMGVHQGRGSNLVFIDWWANENELYHHACISTPEAPGNFEYVTPTGLTGCVWDIAVIAFERQAWIDSVLSAPSPDVGRYLVARFEGEV